MVCNELNSHAGSIFSLQGYTRAYEVPENASAEYWHFLEIKHEN